MAEIEQAVRERAPVYTGEQSAQKEQFLLNDLRGWLRYGDLHRFMSQYEGSTGLEFVEQALDTLELSYRVSDRQRENIPASGRVLIVSNRPPHLAHLLLVLKLVRDVRPDIKLWCRDTRYDLSS